MLYSDFSIKLDYLGQHGEWAGVSHDPTSHDWQNGSWQEEVRDWRPWSFSNDSAEEKKECNSWTQNWRNKALQDEDKPSCQEGGWNDEDWCSESMVSQAAKFLVALFLTQGC